MLETVIKGDIAPALPAEGGKKALHWHKNDRMGGMVPVWEKASTPEEKIAKNLEVATAGNAPENFSAALSYAQGAAQPEAAAAEEFGFGDLVDMVNPLQHLPIVGYLYRELTGDEIKPISKIIGGGVFGGAAGVAAGLVDTAIEYETGKSITGNAVALFTEGEPPQYRSARIDEPEKRLNNALDQMEEKSSDLPGTVIGFADLGYGHREVYEQIPAAEGRTAGTMTHKYTKISAPNPIREPITQLKLDPMPLLLRPEMEKN